LNIYVDGMFFRLSGIGRIYANVMSALVESDEVSRICTLVPRGREDDFRRTYPSGKIDARFVGFPPLGFSDFFRKAKIIRAFRPLPDLHYFPNFNVPSEFTEAEVSRTFGIPPNRMEVIYPWVEERCLQGTGPDRDQARLVEGDYLLFVGNRFVHKNAQALIEAFRMLLPEFPGLRLVFAGARMRRRDVVDEAMSDPVIGGRIVPYPHASDEEIRNLYSFARVFVFPTFIEGFGLPPLEAMAFGVPVVCSDIPVIREVCGDAVRYADPWAPWTFRDMIREILTEEVPLDVYRQKGVERARRFSRSASVVSYLGLFRSAMGIAGTPVREESP
jgi:glycosyltransferase involved in cell wall biosynthesis